MGQRRTHVRAQALRRAQEVGQARDARRRLREMEVEKALAEYFESAGAADRLRERAEARAATIKADAERAAAENRKSGTAALHRLFWLGETRASISELTGLSRAEVATELEGVRRGNPNTDLPYFRTVVAERETATSQTAAADRRRPDPDAADLAEPGVRAPAGERTW